MGKIRKPVIVPLPAGSLGIFFKGAPPVVTRIVDESPLKDLLHKGFVIEKLVFEDGTSISGMSKTALAEALLTTKDMTDRALICKTKLNSNTKKLPPGKLGVTFKGAPPTIVAIASDSPMRKKLKTGYVVESLTLENGTEYSEMRAMELVQALTRSIDSTGRLLYVDIPPPPYLAKIVLPAGPLGVSFKGMPPVVASLTDDCPLRGKIQVGTVVQRVLNAEGVSLLQSKSNGEEEEDDSQQMSLLTTKELVRLLKDTSTQEGRVLRLGKATVGEIEGPKGTKPGGTWLLQKYGGFFGERDERYVYHEPAPHKGAAAVLYDENGQVVKSGKTRPISKDMAQRLSGAQMLSTRNLMEGQRGSLSSSMREMRSLSIGHSSTGTLRDTSSMGSSRRRSTSAGPPTKR